MSEVEVVLDISRLLSRILAPAPTGVDRVELAYVRRLGGSGMALSFTALNPLTGRQGRLPPARALACLDATERRWRGTRRVSPLRWRIESFWRLALLGRMRGRRRRADTRRVVLLVSHHLLADKSRLDRLAKTESAPIVAMIHDLIPIEYPEYARPGDADRHALRINNVVGHATALIANSEATARALRARIGTDGKRVAVAAIPLGVDRPGSPAPAEFEPSRPKQPYFLMLGTIEPRKNHLLLLTVWRRLAETLPPDRMPTLVLAGRRGWENENVVDMIERCPACRAHVVERNDLSDAAVGDLLRHARALLLPSFAEGFGLPVAEALAAGVPVVCSDLPVLREAGTAPLFLDPLDGPAWMRAILDLSADPSPLAEMLADRARAAWPPSWDDHMDSVRRLILGLAA